MDTTIVVVRVTLFAVGATLFVRALVALAGAMTGSNEPCCDYRDHGRPGCGDRTPSEWRSE